ncbi:MAG: hypothetical protein R2856_08015 [Caldilineaceae bacterium]
MSPHGSLNSTSTPTTTTARTPPPSLYDDDGSGSGTLQVTVNNVGPITTIAANQAITEGLPLTIPNVINFSDPGYTALSTSETFTYSIDLGDGSPAVTGSCSG